MKDEITNLLHAEANAVLNISAREEFYAAVELIYLHVHKKNGKIITCGLGKAGQIAINIATTLSSTGTPAVFIHASDAQHGDLGLIQKNDVLLVISNSGKTREVLEFVELSKNLYENLPIIIITGNPEGELAKEADVCILTGHPKEICPLGLTPTTSTTTMTVIGDILVVLMMKKIEFSGEEYAKRHHGGYLGQKSRKMSKNN